MSVRNWIKQIFEEQENRKYKEKLAERCVTYEQWLEEEKWEAWEKANAMSWENDETHPTYYCFVMPWGRVDGGAQRKIAQYFQANPQVQMFYVDEDVWENTSSGFIKSNPWFKPDWSPELLESSFYFGSMVVMRQGLWRKAIFEHSLKDIGWNLVAGVRPSVTAVKVALGAEIGIHTVENVERFQAFIKSCVVHLDGYRRGFDAIGHLPEVLFHCDSVQSQEQYGIERAGDAREKPENPQNEGFVKKQKASVKGTLSIVIPSKDHPEIVETCLKAIPKAAGRLPYEVLLIDNGSSEENKRKIENLVQELSTAERPIRYFYEPMEFHFSKMCNLGAEKATGELLLFLNDDVELAEENVLYKMAELAVQEYTGAVGVKLYYPNSTKIQHAGITNLPMGPVHKLQFLEDDTSYYFDYNRGCRNVLAVTGACLMVEKEKFAQAGGFTEELRVAFNDVDFCFQLYELGYHNVCRNDCYAYHHESLSRGDDESAEKLQRLLHEREILYKRHPELEGRDPYYGKGLGREGLDTGIRPVYETAGNQIQQVEQFTSLKNLTKYRQDNCLLLRVEDSSNGKIQGYAVVLGDDNACYEKMLVLQAVDTEQTAETFGAAYESADGKPDAKGTDDGIAPSQGGQMFAVVVEGQYRPDLVENMPDQINVALCGFHLSLSGAGLPAGKYRIGMLARNRVGRVKLINWSNRTLTVTK